METVWKEVVVVDFDTLKIFLACLLKCWTVFVYSYGYLAKTCQLLHYSDTPNNTQAWENTVTMPKPRQYALDQHSPALVSDRGIAGGEMKARSYRTRGKEIKKKYVLESHKQIKETGSSFSCWLCYEQKAKGVRE